MNLIYWKNLMRLMFPFSWNGDEDNRGIGTVELILILVVLVGLVIIFKNQITTIVTNAFDTITQKSDALQNN